MVASTPNSFDKPETQHDQAMLSTQFYLPLLPRVYTVTDAPPKHLASSPAIAPRAGTRTPHCGASPPLRKRGRQSNYDLLTLAPNPRLLRAKRCALPSEAYLGSTVTFQLHGRGSPGAEVKQLAQGHAAGERTRCPVLPAPATPPADRARAHQEPSSGPGAAEGGTQCLRTTAASGAPPAHQRVRQCRPRRARGPGGALPARAGSCDGWTPTPAAPRGFPGNGRRACATRSSAPARLDAAPAPACLAPPPAGRCVERKRPQRKRKCAGGCGGAEGGAGASPAVLARL